jgi:hypothetical protein
MPADAKVHRSAIRRMESNPTYRPGNLICGGGGRGYITAPKEAGMGEWDNAGEEGDIVGERVTRRKAACKNGEENGREKDIEKSNGAKNQ